MKRISILGSTGSIGVQTLDVVRMFPRMFKVVALSAGNNINLLKKQIEEFKPQVVSVYDEKSASILNKESTINVDVYYGENGNRIVASHEDSDLVISSITGFDGLLPTLEAVKSGKDVAVANKESLVVGGELLMAEVKSSRIKLLPVDSEHSAIFQALEGFDKKFLKNVILTASGGPFLNSSLEDLERVTVAEALNHPTWKMGNKITIDSATMINKGFEVIEAKWLFDLSVDKIKVWIHPQSIVHSMIENIDGSFISHMGLPDMKVPISYALSYPERLNLNEREIKPSDFTNLTFEEVDMNMFPALSLAIDSIKSGGTYPAALNAANEVAVKAFLEKKIKFTDISNILSKIIDQHKSLDAGSLENILEADSRSRSLAISLI